MGGDVGENKEVVMSIMTKMMGLVAVHNVARVNMVIIMTMILASLLNRGLVMVGIMVMIIAVKGLELLYPKVSS